MMPREAAAAPRTYISAYAQRIAANTQQVAILSMQRHFRCSAVLTLLAALAAFGGGCLVPEDGPAPSDRDGDGLTDAEEAVRGTDPDDADTDGNGVADGREVEDETSPLNPYSRRYAEGDYNVGDLDVLPEPTGPTGEGRSQDRTWTAYAVGDIPENFLGTDQYGQEVHLYSFLGQWIMLNIGYEWCPPSRQLASGAQAVQDEHRDAGFQWIEVLTQDNDGIPATAETVERWASEYDLASVPVLLGDQDELIEWETDAAVPTIYWIDPEGVIVSADQQESDPTRFF